MKLQSVLLSMKRLNQFFLCYLIETTFNQTTVDSCWVCVIMGKHILLFSSLKQNHLFFSVIEII